jgi:arginyl-tRNA synthetase
MNIYADVTAQVVAALERLKSGGSLPADLDLGAIEVTPAKDPAHGDMASNAAMVLAKAARMKPRDIADKLAVEIVKDGGIIKAEVAGPGFLNLTLAPARWHGVISAIHAERARYGRASDGKGRKLNVEYVSANPTGPMHIGHCRGAVFGDALANLLAFADWTVTREYYTNDSGAQVDVLARSAHLRYREALGETIGAIPEGLYPGDYLKPVGKALAKTHGRAWVDVPESHWLVPVRNAAIAAMMEMIKEDLAALNIRHDVFFSEASLTRGKQDEVAAAIATLRASGSVFEGRLEKPKGHDDEEWEDREQTLFRSTAFGDDVDRALLKSDGSYTYFASDVAYHYTKLTRGYLELINVFGADHVGYVKRITSAVKALSGGKAHLDIKVCQLVRLLRNGEPVKMSKRAGTFVTLREVVDEVGRDPIRFMMLYRKNDASLDFDLAKVLEQSKDNPVFYVQYGHARAHSVFRNVADTFPELTFDGPEILAGDLSALTDTGEMDLVKRLAFFPELIAGAAGAHEPHRIAFYLYDLAQNFHGQWSRGNDSPHLRFIQPSDRGVTAARLSMVRATAQVLATGLAILGVHAPEEMR